MARGKKKRSEEGEEIEVKEPAAAERPLPGAKEEPPSPPGGFRLLAEAAELLPVESIRRHPRNPNSGDVGVIIDSIKRNGFYGALIVDRATRWILAGNHRYAAALECGYTHLPVMLVDVSEEEGLRILAADNKTAEYGERDEERLAAILMELSASDGGLGGTGYIQEDLDGLLASIGEGFDPEALTDLAYEDDPYEGVDDSRYDFEAEYEEEISDDPLRDRVDKAKVVDGMREKWGVRRGQVWRICGPSGRDHYLMCGSSTSSDDVLLLVEKASSPPTIALSDPPYGISVVKKKDSLHGVDESDGVLRGSVGNGSKDIPASTFMAIAGDGDTDAARHFYNICVEHLGIKDLIIWGGNYFTDFLAPSPSWFVWDKHMGGDFGDVELAWTSYSTPPKKYDWLWSGYSRKGDRSIELTTRMHPTQKPVGMHVHILEDVSKETDVIYDGFLGSGTTMVACEIAARSCIGIEMSEGYCGLILERMSNLECDCSLVFDVEPHGEEE